MIRIPSQITTNYTPVAAASYAALASTKATNKTSNTDALSSSKSNQDKIDAFVHIEKNLPIFEEKYVDAHYMAIARFALNESYEHTENDVTRVYNKLRKMSLKDAMDYKIWAKNRKFSDLSWAAQLPLIRDEVNRMALHDKKFSDAIGAIYTNVDILRIAPPAKLIYEMTEEDQFFLKRLRLIDEWDPRYLPGGSTDFFTRLAKEGAAAVKNSDSKYRTGGLHLLVSRDKKTIISVEGGPWDHTYNAAGNKSLPLLRADKDNTYKDAAVVAAALQGGYSISRLVKAGYRERTIVNALELLGISNRQIKVYTEEAVIHHAFNNVLLDAVGKKLRSLLTNVLRIRSAIDGFNLETPQFKLYSLAGALSSVKTGMARGILLLTKTYTKFMYSLPVQLDLKPPVFKMKGGKINWHDGHAEAWKMMKSIQISIASPR
ncbi:MAG: hypothetical protein JWM36_2670 [Hyphomicrobiales bacterium]|nr:hypothetical protein [Hyphomicrobiales bacterium]